MRGLTVLVTWKTKRFYSSCAGRYYGTRGNFWPHPHFWQKFPQPKFLVLGVIFVPHPHLAKIFPTKIFWQKLPIPHFWPKFLALTHPPRPIRGARKRPAIVTLTSQYFFIPQNWGLMTLPFVCFYLIINFSLEN